MARLNDHNPSWTKPSPTRKLQEKDCKNHGAVDRLPNHHHKFIKHEYPNSCILSYRRRVSFNDNDKTPLHRSIAPDASSQGKSLEGPKPCFNYLTARHASVFAKVSVEYELKGNIGCLRSSLKRVGKGKEVSAFTRMATTISQYQQYRQ